MSEQNRDINNYFPKRLLCFDGTRRQVVTISEILSSFRLTAARADLAFAGWLSEDEFNAGKPPNADYDFAISAPANLILPPLESEIISYLTGGGAAAGWKTEVFLIDMQIKFALIQIRHDDERLISKEIKTSAGFDDLVANYPQIVGLVESFAWTYAQANHQVLKYFN